MKFANALIVAACVMIPGVVGAETYQLWLEMFDEARDTTICKYRSGLGNDEVTEYAGRHLCPRVACEIPPREASRIADRDCAPADALPLT